MNEEAKIVRNICDARIICVVVFEKQEEVAPTIEALVGGGVQAIELALRSPYAISAVELVKKKYPELLLGVGTVLNSQQIAQIAQIADFAVAPGLNRRVIEAARKVGLPFFPGITTASDIETALEYDLRLLKYFPAEAIGGLSYLKNLNAPYAHLNLRYIPLGGVNLENLANYLQSPMVGAVGGSWLASRKLIISKAWSEIHKQTEQAMAINKESRS